ncbi:MAG: O-antigen ligase domain-containing protein [Algoriphagus sp.]|uniref:O-antigen ligase family protein n=1 Tax=Algoriphagus sp. TaxID=1872435 RepID=UPI00272EF0E5|nr:O-antigen ligase domain-containing protein [Algoriphagus sp.]MDP2039891.1 O-antigen ligase domain-containing protein [Algoriphagus sp.]MDP3471251.1 O-antigen ligase domain-containing protein [Algoriphagus sp.]
MALIFFIGIALAVGAGFLWVVQEMIFRGRWSYFIFFLAAFLPFYITSLSIVYLATQSAEVVGMFQILKEVIVLVAILVFLFYQKGIFDYPFRLQSTDWMMLAFLSLGFLYLLLPLGEASFINKALYYKSMLIPGLVYFLGRNTRFSKLEIGWIFKIIFAVAIGAFLVNCMESFLLGAHLQQLTGYALYNQAINDIDPSGNFGLTWTFETQAVTKRLASFFSDPLELASSVLMGFAAGLIWFLTSKKEYNWPYLLVMACSLGSLVFSASRAAFGAFFIMIFFVALVFKLYKLIGAGFLVLVCFGVYVIGFASDDFYFFVLDTITFENSSSLGHVVEWLLALDSMVANPLGIGLAMSGNAGSVTDELRVGGENQFLIYGVQLGWLGMMLYILTMATGVVLSLRVFYQTENTMTARLAFVGAVTKVGLLLPLFTANAEMYTYVAWLSWWMIGYNVKEYSFIKNTTNQIFPDFRQ